jgi:hypothetical protein
VCYFTFGANLLGNFLLNFGLYPAVEVARMGLVSVSSLGMVKVTRGPASLMVMMS